MSLPDPTKLLPAITRGARRARQQSADVPEFNLIADFIGEALESADPNALQTLEMQIRKETPESLPWYLNILRTLSGTVPDSVSVHHVILVPFLTEQPVDHVLVLGGARHELEGQLEAAFDLGTGTVDLLNTATGLSVIEAATPAQWRALAQGEPDAAAVFEDQPLGAEGGALVGVWTVPHTDRARLSRKLMHALSRTPELAIWRQRTQGLLQTRSMDARMSVSPVMQLQDFYSGIRQIRLVRDLERACRELPEVQLLRWKWVDEEVVCSLSDRHGRLKEVRMRFPDEPPELAQARIEGFCERRGVVARSA